MVRVLLAGAGVTRLVMEQNLTSLMIVTLSFLPVLAFQGTIYLLARSIQPWMEARELIDPCNAVGGFLIFSVSLLILEIKKVQVADYLPSLAVAPLLAWVLKAF